MNLATKIISILTIFCSLFLAACSYNPFTFHNNTTGSPTGAIVGAGVGAGSMALLTSSKPLLLLGGIGGGMLGYYVTTLRYDAGGIIHGCGTVYQVGNFIGIVIPTDKLFESNSADFLPKAKPILDSTAAVLARYPNNNILISGNTSGFSRTRWERKLSEKRAQKVSAYLWSAGVGSFKSSSNDTRKLNYVGYGNYFPIASDITNNGIRQNSRIQITSYPTSYDLLLDKRHQTLNNVGGTSDSCGEVASCNEGGGAAASCGECGGGGDIGSDP